MSQQASLTPCEKAVMLEFHCRLITENRRKFTSDDLRRMELHKRLYGDCQHSIGLLFQKMVVEGFVREVGRARSVVESNHGREIRVYEWVTT